MWIIILKSTLIPHHALCAKLLTQHTPKRTECVRGNSRGDDSGREEKGGETAGGSNGQEGKVTAVEVRAGLTE